MRDRIALDWRSETIPRDNGERVNPLGQTKREHVQFATGVADPLEMKPARALLPSAPGGGGVPGKVLGLCWGRGEAG